MAHLGRAVAAQAHHGHRLGVQQSEQRHRKLAAIRDLHEDAVARCDAQTPKPRGGAVGLPSEPGGTSSQRGGECGRVEHGDLVRPAVCGVGLDGIRARPLPEARGWV